MSFQYRKRVRLLPFLWLNLSKTGWSLTFRFGPLSYSAGPKGRRVSASLPGTGLSYRKTIIKRPAGPKTPH
ncbi:TPA: DUF4236 domain-containing protein [Aeromonas hydrophila]|uniref:DUF4236 domain-containing protein n=1 Tax=Aeromonas hydrophila TaxID=644 RepID=UPI003C6FF5D8